MSETIIDITNFESLLNPIYRIILYNERRYLILKGGSGAGKSHFACQKILYRIITEPNHRFLIIRKVKDTIRKSVFQLFRDYISKWELSDEFKINLTDMTITFRSNGNEILFAGVDDPDKLKSIEGVTGIWIEEANELYPNDFEELDRRLRGIFHTYMQIILTFNPILKTNWTYKRFFSGLTEEEKEDITILTTTYKDNIFIKNDLAYKKLLESYTGNMRTVFTLGQYGMLENAIYTNWEMIEDDEFPDDEPVLGLDFGYIAPQALIRTVVDMEEKIIYVDQLSYLTKQTIPELAKDMNDMKLNDYKIIADSEAPGKIEELQNWYYKEERINKETGKLEIIYEEKGFPYIEPCNKGKGSVLAGIDYMQQFRIKITKRSVKVKAEIESYQRKKDKEGNIVEEPEKGFDHSLDALRYIMFTVYYMGTLPYIYVGDE
uniref:Putative terminase n=1 Tax=viral metagenome TaxID=1070528 RepID=A0A6H1ZTH0_9ZZZZ